jgi:flagellar biosynthesis protein FliQ
VNESVFGSLARRAIAWIILIAIALVALKVVVGIAIGLVTTLLSLALLGVLAFAAFWALRRI